MNREIKFRGISTYTHDWVKGGYLRTVFKDKSDDHRIYPLLYNISPHEIKPETLSQFTGLKDGGGNEIYENDFVKFRPNYTNKPIQESIGLVVFNNNQWMLKVSEYYYSISEETDEFYCYSEVVGNINQNPNML